VHADFTTADLACESERLLGLGATVIEEVKENGIRFTTFANPEGNKFDLAAE
jgi:predicted enzyme related to lactoylglutathione lyase